ncbi:hypothetical protein DID80_04835 [Candidatus Marinamargulisbacteria bacterium SCGC AAA071-K20]|nr:hypothetical protein DID80_04835 [Candidatus Marinamargulisbacteria bacterium SCGC AAA071-K20]
MPNPFSIDWQHLKRLTDTNGLFEHAIKHLPNKEHAYCTDDNARAFLFTCYYHHLTKDDTILPYMQKYLNFLHYSYTQKTGWFRNRLSLSRVWDDYDISETAHSRVIWCLGSALLYAPDDIKPICKALLKKGLPRLKRTKDPHSLALGLIGLSYFYKREPSEELTILITTLLQELNHHFVSSQSSTKWPWYSDEITWGSAIITRGFLLGADAISNNAKLQKGQSLLNWIISKQYKNKMFSFIGNKGWYKKGSIPAAYDQQAIEAYTMLEACADAESLFKHANYINYAKASLEWFLGKNINGTLMIDTHSGGCYDGLLETGVNINQGAESTLSWLLSTTKLEINKRELLLKGEISDTKKLSKTLPK